MDLDFHLRKALLELRDSDNNLKGVVAAALVDGTDAVYVTSEKKGDVWLHAERNVLERYISEYGLPSPDAVMVTSLSPCLRDSNSRYGSSCSSMLLGQESDIEIKRVHVGAIDTLQAEKEDYPAIGFDMTMPSDPKLLDACYGLFMYFTPALYGKVDRQEYLDVVLGEI